MTWSRWRRWPPSVPAIRRSRRPGVDKPQLPDADRALEATGYKRGTITPLRSTIAWPVVADTSIVGRRIS